MIFHKSIKKKEPDCSTNYSPLDEEIDDICTQIRFMDNNIKTVLVTSPTDGDGKTTISRCISFGLARQGMHILLVDINFRNPNVAPFFSINNRNGVSSFFLRKTYDVNQLVKKTKIENLSILPSGDGKLPNHNLMKKEQFAELIDKVSSNFDYIIIDGETIKNSINSRVVSTITDATLLVVRQRFTHKEDIVKSKAILDSMHVPFVGAIINSVIK